MNRVQLYRILYRHRSLSARRALDYEQNRSYKYMFYILYTFMFAYLLFAAVMMSLAVNNMKGVNSMGMMTLFLPFILLLDLFIRFFYQQTPAQIVKPYMLLPIPRKVCIESFIGISLFNLGNAFWLVLFVPYCIMSVIFSYGLLATLMLLVFLSLAILLNSQLYLIFQTLSSQSLLWLLGLLPTYFLLALPAIWGGTLSTNSFYVFYTGIGISLSKANVWPLIILLLVLLGVVWLNREIQFRNVWNALTKVNGTTKISGKDRMAFLKHYSEVGEYAYLECKLISRNKFPRNAILTSMLVIALLSVVMSFTAAYDSQSMMAFWCTYNFVLLGLTFFTRLLCMEGNYIDGLMVHPNSIYSLMRAKYYLHCILLIVPFVLMIPIVIVGKISLYMLIGYMLFTAGFQFFILFQSAVYNKHSQKLDGKFFSNRNVDRNYLQMFIGIMTFFFPLILTTVLNVLVSKTVCYTILAIAGIIGILTHKLWIRNVYGRMMSRRYENMEGFRATR